MQNSYSDRVVSEFLTKVDEVLSPAGLLYRAFGRVKSQNSLYQKNTKHPGKYSESGKKIQDFVGIRVTLYFADDTEIAVKLLKSKFQFIAEDSVIDNPEGDVFSARRCNLVFKVPEDIDVFIPEQYQDIVDETFEVQLRTVLSEGWHEVEHDLRYKAQDDWTGHGDLSRALNGIYATLETSDWGMIKLFEELSYRHYKENNFEEMLKTKFRLRLHSRVSQKLKKVIDEEPDLLKKIFRAPRKKTVEELSRFCKFVPLTPDVLVQVINRMLIKNKRIESTEPETFKEQYEQI